MQTTSSRRVASAPAFHFAKYIIKGFLPSRSAGVVFEVTYPKFRDLASLNIYRLVYLEKIQGKKQSTFDKAVLELLSHLERELFTSDDLTDL